MFIDTGAAFGDIVLEKSIEALIAQIELRGQCDDEHIDIEFGEVEGLPEPVNR